MANHVLVVDDDIAVMRVYGRVLRAAGFEVTEADDSVRAVELARQHELDAIVSDIAMPRMTGLGLLKAVRQYDLDVPVILLTGLPSLDSAIQAVEHGAFRYLPKPVDTGELVKVVKQATHMREFARLKRRALEILDLQQMQLGDRASLEVRFSSALESLWMAYQPIVSWSKKRVLAFEALARTGEPTLLNPVALFDAAERLGRMDELGRVTRKKIADVLPDITHRAQLFVNLNVRDLLDERLFTDLPLDPFAPRIVLEITERASLHQVPDLQARIARLRAKGYRMAVDDLGAGYAGLTTFTQLEPEIVKLDMMLIRDIDGSPKKQKLVQSMTQLCGEMGAQVVAEGIETEAERKVITELGCDLLQGYHFARPGPAFPSCPGFVLP